MHNIVFDGHPHPPCELLRGQKAHVHTHMHRYTPINSHPKRTHPVPIAYSYSFTCFVTLSNATTQYPCHPPTTQDIHFGFHTTPLSPVLTLYIRPSVLSACLLVLSVNHGFTQVSNSALMDVWLQSWKTCTAQVSQSSTILKSTMTIQSCLKMFIKVFIIKNKIFLIIIYSIMISILYI